MQAILVYNPNSRRINSITPDELEGALREAGYEPVYEATNSEQDLDSILAEVEGLVVAAGGDGTVRAVATRLIGKGVPLALLPLGTANNISKALGLEGTPLEIIAGLKNPYRRPFNIGYVRAPWGDDYFVEGLGYGLYADMLATYDPNPEEGKSLLKAISSAATTLANYQSYPSRMTLDNKDISGDYLLVEVLNTTAVGPRLKFAPEADSGDGLFEVVCVREDARDGFLRYVMSLLTETLEDLPSVEVMRGQRLEFVWTDFPIHVDGEVRPDMSEPSKGQSPAKGAKPASRRRGGSLVSIEVLPQALELWLPQPESS